MGTSIDSFTSSRGSISRYLPPRSRSIPSRTFQGQKEEEIGSEALEEIGSRWETGDGKRILLRFPLPLIYSNRIDSGQTRISRGSLSHLTSGGRSLRDHYVVTGSLPSDRLDPNDSVPIGAQLKA